MKEREVVLSFRCSSREAKPIYREALRRRMSVSQYLRSLVLQQSSSSSTQQETVEKLSKNA